MSLLTLFNQSEKHMADGPFDPAFFDPAFFDTGATINFASVDWTGVEQRLAADPGAIAEISRQIAELDALVEKAGLTNAELAKAKSITGALRCLVESPEPEWKVIVALLNSPNITALCNAITVGGVITCVIAGIINHIIG